jgi:glycosyltransferase involved in cell wall biosynthesis
MASPEGVTVELVREPVDLSVVIPVHNEEGNLPPLLLRLDPILERLGLTSEVIVVDDGSTDGTRRELAELRGIHRRLTVVQLRRRFQKAAAYTAGFRTARGRIIVTMDGDGQDDPSDLPNLLHALGRGFDLASGWKKAGKGPWSKRIPSRLFNVVTSAITRIPLHDFNCPFKAYRREVTEDLQLYGELHRFIPVLAHGKGYRITEVPVANLPRTRGRSKYGTGRLMRGYFDLLTVVFLMRYTQRPLHFFGGFGALIFTLGFGIALYLFVLKMLTGTPFAASFPLLLFSILLMVLGFQTFSLGLLSDLLVRRSAQESLYTVETILGGDRPAGSALEARRSAIEDPSLDRLWSRLRSLHDG